MTALLRLLACVVMLVLAGCASTSEGARHLLLSDDGQSEIEVSRAWAVRPNISAQAPLRLADADSQNFLRVATYLDEDTEDMPLEEFSSRIGASMVENLGQGKLSDPRVFRIKDRPAVERQIRANGIVYLSTVVRGSRARYHLLGWTDADGDLGVLRQAVAGFRESEAARQEIKRVHLVFKWPDRLKSQSSSKIKSRKRGEEYEVQADGEMTLKRVSDEELLVSTRVTRHKITYAGRDAAGKEKDKAKDEYLQNLMRAVTAEFPDYVVNTDGEFVRVENLTAYHRRVQDAMLKGLPTGNNREAQAKARELVQSMLTEDTLVTAYQESWAQIVGNWAGGAYAIGHRYDYTLPYQAPALGERGFPMGVTQELTGYVPCKAGAAPQSCVRLLQTSRVQGADYTRAMDAYVRKTVGNDVRVTDMEIVTTVELVTDPRTLLPHASRTRETKRVTIRAQGQSVVNEDLKEENTTYRY